MKFTSIFLSLFLLTTSHVFACVKNEPSLISLKFSKLGDSSFRELEISLPKFYDGERLNSMYLVQINNLGETSTQIPLGYEVKTNTANTTLSMEKNEYESWDLVAMYSRLPLTKIENGNKVTYIQLDGCMLQARRNLKYNKKRNKMDGSVEPPIR